MASTTTNTGTGYRTGTLASTTPNTGGCHNTSTTPLGQCVWYQTFNDFKISKIMEQMKAQLSVLAEATTEGRWQAQQFSALPDVTIKALDLAVVCKSQWVSGSILRCSDVMTNKHPGKPLGSSMEPTAEATIQAPELAIGLWQRQLSALADATMQAPELATLCTGKRSKRVNE